ncbi:MAG: hypothetical protein JJT81_11375 [Rubellimicrobium sp.]|nr:hypothetical protein [Rubellimicrobium sp.]
MGTELPPVMDPTEVTFPLRLLDVRDDESFAAGHAAGAVRVPIEDWVTAARTTDGDLSKPDYWSRAIRSLGLGAGVISGVFDDGRMTEAARVWFILQYFGLPAVILNGGWPDVREAGLDGATAASEPPLLHPGSGPIGLVDRETLKSSLGLMAVLDARSEAEFGGQDLKGNARGGHLPGAVLLPHIELLEGTRLRPPLSLREQFSVAGFTPGQPVATHCDGGGRAALAAVAALQAGLGPVAVYYQSFTDWAADETCPIVAATRDETNRRPEPTEGDQQA